MLNLKKFSLIKYSIPVGLAVMSNQLRIGAAKFAKVPSIGVLELVVPAGVFVGYFMILNRIKRSAKKKEPEYQGLPPAQNYDEYYSNLNNQPQPNYNERAGWDCDREFVTRRKGIKTESFLEGRKTTVYEYEEVSNYGKF